MGGVEQLMPIRMRAGTVCEILGRSDLGELPWESVFHVGNSVWVILRFRSVVAIGALKNSK